MTLVDDASDEPDETIIVDMGTPTNATAVAPTTHTLTITDNDNAPTVQWTAASQSVAENVAGGTVTVTAQLSAVSANIVTVDFALTGSTATLGAGNDFTTSPTATLVTPGTLTFTPRLSQCERDRHDQLTTPSTSQIRRWCLRSRTRPTRHWAPTTVHTLTITDDDAPPSVQWTTITASITEGTASPGNQVTVTAQLSAASEQTVTVNVATGGSATDGGDYTRTPSTASPFTLTFTPGVTTQNVVITVTDDTSGEPDETATLTLQAPLGNVTLGAQTIFTLTIIDNDPTASPDNYSATGNVPADRPATAETPGCTQTQTTGLLCNDFLRGATLASFGPSLRYRDGRWRQRRQRQRWQRHGQCRWQLHL